MKHPFQVEGRPPTPEEARLILDRARSLTGAQVAGSVVRGELIGQVSAQLADGVPECEVLPLLVEADQHDMPMMSASTVYGCRASSNAYSAPPKPKRNWRHWLGVAMIVAGVALAHWLQRH